MAGRSLLPIIVFGALSTTAASAGIGYGLGQYTVSGINPFYTAPHPVTAYRDEAPATPYAYADPAARFTPPSAD